MYIVDNLNIINNINNQKIIDSFSLVINDYDKIALIGEEGSGKSSLIKFLVKQDLPYAKCTYDKQSTNTIFAYVQQERFEHKQSVLEFLGQNNLDIDYKLLYYLIDGFNISDKILERENLNSLSGGEYSKIDIIRALISNYDLLVLDEPTNNLDLASIIFLEKVLLELDKPFIFASHDRSFIRNIANKIIHLEQVQRRRLPVHHIYANTYDDFISIRQSRIDNQNQKSKTEHKEFNQAKERYDRLYNKVKHAGDNVTKAERDFVASRIKTKMSAVKSAGYRLDRQEANLTKKFEGEAAAEFILNHIDTPASKEILRLNLDKLTIADKVLADSIQLDIIGPEKIAIIGDNGVGKTTLVKEIMAASLVDYAYMPQTYAEVLDINQSPVELLASSRNKADISKAMTHLGSLNFKVEEMQSPFKDLSGGQKAKVYFALMSLRETQLLILDEPSRNISPLSLDTLIHQLQAYQGAIIVITHNRDLLNTVFDKVYQLSKDGLKLLAKQVY